MPCSPRWRRASSPPAPTAPRTLARTRPSSRQSVQLAAPTPRRVRYVARSSTRSPSTARRTLLPSSPPKKSDFGYVQAAHRTQDLHQDLHQARDEDLDQARDEDLDQARDQARDQAHD